MGKLLKFEFHKLLRKTSYYVCLSVAAFMVIITLLALKGSEKLLTSVGDTEFVATTDENGEIVYEEQYIGTSEEYDFGMRGTSCVTSAFNTMGFITILSIFIIIYVNEDHRFCTYKNILAKGYSRWSIQLSKYIAVLAGTAVYAVTAWVLAFVTGSLLWSVGPSFTALEIGQLGVQFVIILAYATLFFFVASLVKAVGGAIPICIVGPQMVALGLSILEYLVLKKTDVVSIYWIDNLLGNCAGKATHQLLYLGVALLYTVVFAVGGVLVVRKREA